jgi:hypothetical protein
LRKDFENQWLQKHSKTVPQRGFLVFLSSSAPVFHLSQRCSSLHVIWLFTAPTGVRPSSPSSDSPSLTPFSVSPFCPCSLKFHFFVIIFLSSTGSSGEASLKVDARPLVRKPSRIRQSGEKKLKVNPLMERINLQNPLLAICTMQTSSKSAQSSSDTTLPTFHDFLWNERIKVPI